MAFFGVIGLGRFGSNVARALYERGEEVLALDRDPERVEEVRPFVSQAVVADCRDREALAAAALGDADAAVVSVGQEMEASILATLYLKELGVRKIVAKALTADHAKVLRRLGATEVVFPERDMAYRLAERLSLPNVFEHFAVAEGFSAAELLAPAPLAGRTLREAELRRRYGVTVVALRKQGGGVIVAPDGSERIEPGDVLVVIGPDEQIRAFERL
ncbi:MAG TPA: TrkA family potassium uptake protein [Thermodesulfobacteriota bacterium]|nr:TrkA family potassium uptake protein [Thermodesulfobacteriota bacterium]